MGEDKELIGRGGYDKVDAAVGCRRGGGTRVKAGDQTRRPQRTRGGNPGRARGGPIVSVSPR